MPISTIPLPDTSKIVEVTGQGFWACPPIVDGPCNLSAWTTEAESIFKQQFFPARSVKVYSLQNVYVCQEGLVYDENGRSFLEIASLFSPTEVIDGHRLVQQSLWDGVVEHFRKPAILCKRPTPFVYGHWLVDTLPCAHLALRHLPVELAKTVSVVLHRTSCTIDTIMAESLDRLGVEPHRLIWTTTVPIFFESLIVVDGMTDHGKYISPYVNICHTEMSAGVPSSGFTRLFIQRQGGYGRELREERQLSEIARDAGFLVFDPGIWTLEAQISLFKDATQIIGAIGSAMANVIYAPVNAQLTVLMPESMPDSFYWLLCQLRRQKYREIRCEEVGAMAPDGRPPWHRDFTLQTYRFKNALESFI